MDHWWLRAEFSRHYRHFGEDQGSAPAEAAQGRVGGGSAASRCQARRGWWPHERGQPPLRPAATQQLLLRSEQQPRETSCVSH